MRVLSIVLALVFIMAVGAGTVSAESRKHKKNISSTLSEEHPDNWADEDLHGEHVEKYGNSKCKECHGENLKGNDDAPSCRGCHNRHDDDDDDEDENHNKKRHSKYDDDDDDDDDG